MNENEKIELEIVEFYFLEAKANYFKGSMHVYLVNEKIDLRGILVIKRGDTWFFCTPSFKEIHSVNKERVRFPIFSFKDKNKNKLFIKTIIEKGKKFIEDKITNSKPSKQH